MTPIAVTALCSKKTSRGEKAQHLHNTEGLQMFSQKWETWNSILSHFLKVQGVGLDGCVLRW